MVRVRLERPPSGIPAHPARIRSFHPRRGRVSGRHEDAMARLWPRYGLDVPTCAGPAIRPAELFGRPAPVVLEIGSGMGESTAAMAAADPGRDYLAVEVHLPGLANLLALIEEQGLTNLRVARGDALDLVRHLLPVDSLDAVHVFFPDPWPKARHHKRRLIRPDNVALLRSRLVPGGILRCATDWPEYAAQMLATLDADPQLRNAYPGYAPRPAWRPCTKFERRALAAGRPVADLAFHRVPAAADPAPPPGTDRPG